MSQSEATLLLRIKQLGQGILDKFVITLGDVVDMAKSVAEAIYSTVEAYREKELAVNELTQSMINQGIFTGELRDKYLAMAEALQELTTFGNEQIISAEGILQSFVGQKEVTEDLVKATLDFAAAKKIDLTTAANLVGKAIANDTEVLSRYGVQVRQSKDETQKMANVIEALNGKFEGQAAAAAKGLGVIDQLKNNWGDFLTKIGALMAPFITLLAEAANGALKLVNAFLPEHFDAAKSSLSGINQEILKLRREIIKIQETAAQRGTGMDQFEIAMVASLEKQIADNKAAQQKMLDDQKASADKTVDLEREKNQKIFEENLKKTLQDQDRMVQIGAAQDEDWATSLEKEMAYLQQRLQQTESYEEQKRIIAERGAIAEELVKANHIKTQLKLEQEAQKQTLEDRKATLSTIATLQNSHNSTLAAIGKAAAITQIAIETPVAIARALSAFPPPFNFAAAGLVGAAMAAQAARIAGVQLAEGGIVRARPGGMPAIIGEGGRDEAVIPLEDGRIPGSGGGITININGPFMGDETQARALAKMIDEHMFHMRRNNESMAFDSGVL